MTGEEGRVRYTRELIAELLKDRSQRELASLTGVPQSRISDASGSGRMSTRNLLRLAKFAGRPPEDVYAFLAEEARPDAAEMAREVDATATGTKGESNEAVVRRLAFEAIPARYRDAVPHLLRAWHVEPSNLEPTQILEIADELDRAGRYFAALANVNAHARARQGADPSSAIEMIRQLLDEKLRESKK